jgi:hypothetical protein
MRNFLALLLLVTTANAATFDSATIESTLNVGTTGKFLNNSFEVGTVDPFGRTQFWNKATNASIRLGSLGQDGDPTDVSSEGSVFYGPNSQGTLINSATGNFGYARIKADRFGLYTSINNSAFYYFRADPTELFLANDSNVKTFTVTRSTGAIKTALGTGVLHSNSTGNLTSSLVDLTTDVTGILPTANLPAAVLGSVNYQGTWDASTNSPTIVSSTGTKGYYRVVDVAGTTTIDGHNNWSVGDWIVFNGTIWDRVGATGASILSLNTLTAATQTFATGTTGSDFGISSSGSTHTFNLPTASATNRGALSSADWSTFNSKGSGTVTAVSVTSANGLAGSSSGGATPALTLSTSVNGIAKGNGTGFSAATSGTDYSAGTSALATGILKSTTTSGALSIAAAGDFPTLNQNTTGTAAKATNIVGGLGGSIPYQSAVDTTVLLANGTAGQVLQSNGTTLAPSWVTPSSGGITALTSDVTASGSGSVAATIAANAVTNAKAAQMAANTIKGNNTGSTANASDLTKAQLKTMLGLDGVTAVTCTTSLAMDFTNVAEYDITLTNGSTCVLTITGLTAGSAAAIRIIQGSSGTGLVTWPSGFKWSGGTVPTLTATNASLDIISVNYNGTNYIASAGLNFL